MRLTVSALGRDTFFDYQGEREQLRRWVNASPPDAWAARRFETNAVSIDGLPGLSPYGEGSVS